MNPLRTYSLKAAAAAAAPEIFREATNVLLRLCRQVEAERASERERDRESIQFTITANFVFILFRFYSGVIVGAIYRLSSVQRNMHYAHAVRFCTHTHAHCWTLLYSSCSCLHTTNVCVCACRTESTAEIRNEVSEHRTRGKMTNKHLANLQPACKRDGFILLENIVLILLWAFRWCVMCMFIASYLA